MPLPLKYSSSDETVATINAMELGTALLPGMTTITAAVDGVSGDTLLTVIDPDITFEAFVIDRARVELEGGGEDEFRVRGEFTLGAGSDGINVQTEDITIKFDGFMNTIPAGSCCEITLPGGGSLEVDIEAGGDFEVEAKDIDLMGINLNVPVTFSLQIGDDIGTAMIEFDSDDRFEARVWNDRLTPRVVLATFTPGNVLGWRGAQEAQLFRVALPKVKILGKLGGKAIRLLACVNRDTNGKSWKLLLQDGLPGKTKMKLRAYGGKNPRKLKAVTKARGIGQWKKAFPFCFLPAAPGRTPVP